MIEECIALEAPSSSPRARSLRDKSIRTPSRVGNSLILNYLGDLRQAVDYVREVLW